MTGAPCPLKVFPCEPWVPKCRSISRSSRDRPFHLCLIMRNSRLCLALFSLLVSLRASFEARLRTPLLSFPALGLVGREGSESSSEVILHFGWACAGHRWPQQSLQSPGGGNCANSRPASRRLSERKCNSSGEWLECGELW